jgi:hypothetical protein
MQVQELPSLRPVVLLAKYLLQQAGCYRAGTTSGMSPSKTSPPDMTSTQAGGAAGTDIANGISTNGSSGSCTSACSVSGTALAHMAAASIREDLRDDTKVVPLPSIVFMHPRT